jgi:hypothetical protein
VSAVEVLSRLLAEEIPQFALAQELQLVAPVAIGKALGCTRRCVERYIFLGELPAVRVAGKTYVSRQSVLTWFERKQQQKAESRSCRISRRAVRETAPLRKGLSR